MDCLEGLRLLDDSCIDLTVTSPPYDNLRVYNGYSLVPDTGFPPVTPALQGRYSIHLSYRSIEAVLTSSRPLTGSPITFILLEELGACISLDVYASFNISATSP